MFGKKFGSSNNLFGARNRAGDSEEVQERVVKLAETLLEIYMSESDPDTISSNMRVEISSAGFKVLGTGQNRIAFREEGSSWVYKVPFREIGLRDNAIERYISSWISREPKIYNELAKHTQLVNDFSLGENYENFMICAEFIDDLVPESYDIGSQQEKAIFVCVDNYKLLSDVVRKFNKYFHLVDIHPVISAVNFGVKDGEIAIRDLGYFVPRVGDLAELTANLRGTEYPIAYLPFDQLDLTAEEEKDVRARIRRFEETTEHWVAFDTSGNIASRDETEMYEAADCMETVLREFEQKYLYDTGSTYRGFGSYPSFRKF